MSTDELRILLVEDNSELSQMLANHFRSAGCDVDIADDGPQGVTFAKNAHFDLAIIDYNLPSMSGVEVVSAIRRFNQQLPILMLTSRSEELDKVVGLNAGADDYVTKPFGLAELVARCNALVRRSSLCIPGSGGAEEGPRVFGELSIDTSLREVRKGGELVSLTPLEYSLTSVVARLRKKIEDTPRKPKYLLTERGFGYRFVRPDEL